MTILGHSIFEFEINWIDPVNGEWDFDLRELRLGFGPELIDPQQDDIVHGFEFTLHVREGDIDDLDEFMDALEGRAHPFWLPGPSAWLKITEGINATTFHISEQGADESFPLQAGAYVWFTKAGETSQTGKIESIVIGEDNEITVTLEDALSTAVDSTWKIFPLYLVRLAEDTERAQLAAERFQIRTLRVVELPHDYALLGGSEHAPSKPVFFYRFTAALPDGAIVWRFTSHPTDRVLQGVAHQSSSSSSSSASESESSSESYSSQSSSSSPTVTSLTSSSSSSSSSNSSSSYSSRSAESYSSQSLSSSSSSSSSSTSSNSSSSSSTEASESSSSSGDTGETVWLAVGIQHSRLSRTARIGGTCTITADVDEVEPLRLLLPMRLSVPLKVEILKTSTSLDEPEVLFNGTVRKPQIQGRQISVECIEWGDMLDGKITGFYIQPNCNYRVYDANTCRVNRAAFEVSVTIVSQTGRTISVSGADITGKPENWFALGWLDVGSGLSRRVFYVVANTVPSGDTTVLTVTDDRPLEYPVSATLVPGCDGSRATCISKFDNLVNFGGHETPQDNLTLVAIRTNPSTGGKK